MRVVDIKEKENCCGCFACFNVCPKSAIEMKDDEYGFKYPVIDKEKCINCGLCDKICPILNKSEIKNKPQAYACVNKNEKVRLQSSSGGMFSIIAEYILNNNGAVFGASFDDEFNVKHICIENKEELWKLRTSKYVQSYIGDTYKQAKAFLENKRIVLFTGTPCQIEGLYAFLGKDYENLFTQDFICHGVPSPKVWSKYKDYRKHCDKKDPLRINFRSKAMDWNNFAMEFTYETNKRYVKIKDEDLFQRAFLNDVCLRDSCYNCSFKKPNRVSDITLADFWGIKKIIPDMYSGKGVSLMVINSNKGLKLLSMIKDNCIMRKLSEEEFAEALNYNKGYLKSAKRNPNRERFFEQLESDKFNKTVFDNIPNNMIKRSKTKIKNVIKRFIYKVIK